MPSIARKILICAAVDGLVIQPLSPKGQRPFQPSRIEYGSNTVSQASLDQISNPSDSELSFEAFGIIGLITVSKLSYLISITRRQQVAQIFGSPIYVVTEVAVTPCSSETEAQISVRRTHRSLAESTASGTVSEDGETSGDEAESRSSIADEVEDATASKAKGKEASPRSSVAEDVIHKRGTYGRFARSWFSRSGWTQDQQRSMGMSNSPTLAPTKPTDTDAPQGEGVQLEDSQTLPGEASNLLPKLLKTAQILFGSSRSFYFSYDFDITRTLGQRTEHPKQDVPLYEQVECTFFWNQNLLSPFLEAGQDSVALPLMQGFVGQRHFTVDSNPPQVDATGRHSVEMCNLSPSEATEPDNAFEKAKDYADGRASEQSYTVTLISRRSVKRAGLRYLRRGINEDGFVANAVETEQLLYPSVCSNSSQVQSFLQIRGSIPLFFTQTPYAFKPAPVLQYSDETNRRACQMHFERLIKSYGAIQAVNLVEKHGVESTIGNRYEKTVKDLTEGVSEGEEASPRNGPGISPVLLAFEWFDFHEACRGMKFENVSLLLSILSDKLENFGSTRSRDGALLESQKGVVRTNCMDCLDRTNVCQSSFAKHMLELQLKQEGYDMSAQVDQETSWFNTLWADNGDAISKQYASTAAMKGDYTRTKKRDYRGALNDLGLSLARFYSGMVNDYFSQTAIDFLLGNVTDKVFEEFEADMMTKDPAVSISKLREQAIELCQRRVVADEKEEFHGGWALLSPREPDSVRALPMEEVVLLLTDAALYLCRLDWNMDKVSSFERINLDTLTGIKVGTYITSTVSTSQADESRNVGFIVAYQPGKNNVQRTNTRTLSTRGDLNPMSDNSKAGISTGRPLSFIGYFSGSEKPAVVHRLAFKAPYVDSSVTAGASPQQSETQLVNTICEEVERLALESRLYKAGEERQSIIEKGDVISLEEAKRNTGLLEQLGHSIRKLIWT